MNPNIHPSTMQSGSPQSVSPEIMSAAAWPAQAATRKSAQKKNAKKQNAKQPLPHFFLSPSYSSNATTPASTAPAATGSASTPLTYLWTSAQYGDIPLEALGLSNRSCNLLKRNGIHDLSSLVTAYYRTGFSAGMEIGRAALTEIGMILRDLNPDIMKSLLPDEDISQIQDITDLPDLSSPQNQVPSDSLEWMNAPKISGPILEQCKEISVDALNLSQRVQFALKRNGIDDLNALVTKYYADGLATSTYIGKRAQSEIGAFLKRLTPNIVKTLHSKNKAARDLLEQQLSITISENPPLPQDILKRPLTDLRISSLNAHRLSQMQIETIEQALEMLIQDKTRLAQKDVELYQTVREKVCQLLELGDRYFIYSSIDVRLVKKLMEDYGLRQSLLAQWLGVSVQRISQALQKTANRGRWQGATLADEDKRIFLDMAASASYFHEVEVEVDKAKVGVESLATPPSTGDTSHIGDTVIKKYVILNNHRDDAALLSITGKVVKCWFLADLPEAIRAAVVKADMHRLTERESHQTLGRVVSVLRRQYFCPNDVEKFRRVADQRNMSMDEYSMWRYHLPYCKPSGLVTDDRIVKFFEENLKNGKVHIPSIPENRWIYSFSFKHGLSVNGLIEFYGYQGRNGISGQSNGADGQRHGTDGQRNGVNGQLNGSRMEGYAC